MYKYRGVFFGVLIVPIYMLNPATFWNTYSALYLSTSCILWHVTTRSLTTTTIVSEGPANSILKVMETPCGGRGDFLPRVALVKPDYVALDSRRLRRQHRTLISHIESPSSPVLLISSWRSYYVFQRTFQQQDAGVNKRSSQGYQHYGLPWRDDTKVRTCISLRRPGFYPGPVHEGFLTDNVALEQVSG